jgi:hypothetical protein
MGQRVGSRVGSIVAVVAALLAPASLAHAGTLYNVGVDWSLEANPSGPWSYNQGTTALPFVQVDWGGVTGETFWTTTSSGVVPPAWAKAVTTRGADHWEPGDVIGHSTTPPGTTANITWTSPAAGTITISGRAWDAEHIPGRDDAWRLRVAGDLVAERASIVGVARSDTGALFSGNLVAGKTLAGLPVAKGDTVVFEIQATTATGHFVGVDLTIDYVGANPLVCYKAGLAPGQPRFPGDTTVLEDQFGGPAPFDVKAIASLCNPADVDGLGVPFPDVHQVGFKIKATAPFAKSTHVVVDAFATRTLTVGGPAVLLDVARAVPGATPPPPFASDPTADPNVNRFLCYKAALAKGEPGFVPPVPPTITDTFFPGGQAVVLKKVTKLCTPVDKDGETPGAEARAGHLVCYLAKLPAGTPKLAPQAVAIGGTNFGDHPLVAKSLAELCMPAIKDP